MININSSILAIALKVHGSVLLLKYKEVLIEGIQRKVGVKGRKIGISSKHQTKYS